MYWFLINKKNHSVSLWPVGHESLLVTTNGGRKNSAPSVEKSVCTGSAKKFLQDSLCWSKVSNSMLLRAIHPSAFIGLYNFLVSFFPPPSVSLPLACLPRRLSCSSFNKISFNAWRQDWNHFDRFWMQVWRRGFLGSAESWPVRTD